MLISQCALSINSCHTLLFCLLHAQILTRQEVLARMFVTAVWIYFESNRQHGNFASLLPQLGVPHFLCRGCVISRHLSLRVVTRSKRDVFPGYDDNKDVPIGCFVAKDDL